MPHLGWFYDMTFSATGQAEDCVRGPPREPEALVGEIETERGVMFTEQVKGRMFEAAGGADRDESISSNSAVDSIKADWRSMSVIAC